MPFDDTVDLRQILRRIAQFFRDESCGSAFPAASARRQKSCWPGGRRPAAERGSGAAQRARAGDARCVHLRPRPDRFKRHRIALSRFPIFQANQQNAGRDDSLHDSAPDAKTPFPVDRARGAAARPRRTVEADHRRPERRVPEGATLLDAARQLGIETPTLCFLENLTPVNVCRICVVEVEARARSSPPVHASSDR